MRLHNLNINFMSGLLLKLNRFNNNLFVCQVFTQLSCSDIGINLTCHSNRHSINHLSTTQHFHLNNNFFASPSNPFAMSTMIPSSAYNLMSSMQYYRPTMPLQVSENQSEDNEVEDNDDDIPPPPPPTIPSEQQSQG